MSLLQTGTFIIAIYGAVISTILAIREIRKDRKRILTILEYVEFLGRAQVTITNIGHRPITITEVGMSTLSELEGGGDWWESVPRNVLFDPEIYVDGIPLPVTLNDGDHVTLPLNDALSGILSANQMKARITVSDVQGNEYREFKTRLHNPKWGYYGKL